MRDRKKLLVEMSRKILSVLRSRGRASRARITEAVLEGEQVSGDELKNVQRRVYDAVNVLEALDVVRKDGGLLRYCASSIDCTLEQRRGKIQAKRRLLREAVSHYMAIQSLIRRNQALNLTPNPLFLPMILVKSQTAVSLTMSDRAVLLRAATPILVQNDTQLLASLRLHHSPSVDLPTDLLALVQGH